MSSSQVFTHCFLWFVCPKLLLLPPGVPISQTNKRCLYRASTKIEALARLALGCQMKIALLIRSEDLPWTHLVALDFGQANGQSERIKVNHGQAMATLVSLSHVRQNQHKICLKRSAPEDLPLEICLRRSGLVSLLSAWSSSLASSSTFLLTFPSPTNQQLKQTN